MTYSSADDFYLEGYEHGFSEGLERGRSEALQARLIAIEECAKIAEKWFGNNIGKLSFGPSPQDAIAAEIRALSSPLSSNKGETA